MIDGVTLTGDQIKKMSATIKDLGVAINTGAFTFLQREYKYRTSQTVLCILFILVSAAVNWRTGLCFLAGATARPQLYAVTSAR